MYGWIHSDDLKAYGFVSPALQHLSADDLRRILPDETFNKYFKFAVIRNPWDRMLSQYLFDREFKQSGNEREESKDFSFDEFDEYIKALPAFLMQEQYRFITDDNGQLLVDFVARFEKLGSDFQRVCKKIGISDRYLPHINTSRHTHYSAYYTEDIKQTVQELFAKDIEMFGYQFEKNDRVYNRIQNLAKTIRHKFHRASKF